MLSRKNILEQIRMNAQYGPPEASFSPDPHLNRITPDFPVLTAQGESRDGIQIILGHVVDPETGDLRIRQFASVEEMRADPNHIPS